MAVVTGRPRYGQRWEFVLSATTDTLPYPVTAESIYVMVGATSGAVEVKLIDPSPEVVIYSGTPATGGITSIMGIHGSKVRIDTAVVKVPTEGYVVINTLGHTVEPP